VSVGAVVWITGIPAAGKTTLALALAEALTVAGLEAEVLDGDRLRTTVSADLGFGREARAEQARRAAVMAIAHATEGAIALVALVSPFAADRDAARALAGSSGVRFVEVHVDPGLAVCQDRDPKGLYAAAAAGEITELTGYDAPYEQPAAPEVHLVGPPPVPVDDAVRRVRSVL
jgi:adenylyl-sulfate kinase